MRIGVLGGTGGVGTHFVRLALERGHQVVVLARTPSKVQQAQQVQVIQGDASNAEDVAKVVTGADLVVSCVGNASGNLIMLKTAQHILAAGAARVFVVSTIGVGGTSTLVWCMLRMFLGRKNIDDYWDADALVQKASCPWIVCRPPGLSHEPGTGEYLATEEVPVRCGNSMISREDVALFLADRIEDTTWDRKAVQVLPHA